MIGNFMIKIAGNFASLLLGIEEAKFSAIFSSTFPLTTTGS
jgi:hypothetical protein